MKVDMVSDLQNEFHGDEYLKIETMNKIEERNKDLFKEISKYLEY